ncbi:MAG: GNAT family N-acetyltransferase [Promethearchaeota archaeon]
MKPLKLVKLDATYLEQYKTLLKLTFPADDEFEQEWGKIFLQHEDLWTDAYGWVDGDDLVAAYSSYTGEMQIRKKSYPVKFIENVATLPSYRNQRLISTALKGEMAKYQGGEVSFLCLGPFKHAYYRNLGFESGMDSQRLEMDFDFLSSHLGSESGYTTKMGYLHTHPEFQEAMKLVQQWYWAHSRYNEIKDPKIFTDTIFKLTKSLIAVAYDENGTPKGYFVYQEKDRKISVHAFRYINLAAFYVLKKYILSYRDQVAKIQFNSLPPDFPIDLLVENMWLTGKKFVLSQNPWQMLRILNVQKLLPTIMEQTPEEEIFLQVYDRQIDGNNGIFRLSPSGEAARMDDIAGKVSVSIAISDLVTLITGRKSARELYLTGKLAIPDGVVVENSENIPPIILSLEKMFPKQVTYCGG